MVNDQLEGGQEVTQAAYLGYEATRPITGTASRGAELFRRKAAGTAVAPGVGTAIGIAAGYAAGVAVEAKDTQVTNRNRKINLCKYRCVDFFMKN